MFVLCAHVYFFIAHFFGFDNVDANAISTIIPIGEFAILYPYTCIRVSLLSSKTKPMQVNYLLQLPPD